MSTITNSRTLRTPLPAKPDQDGRKPTPTDPIRPPGGNGKATPTADGGKQDASSGAKRIVGTAEQLPGKPKQHAKSAQVLRDSVLRRSIKADESVIRDRSPGANIEVLTIRTRDALKQIKSERSELKTALDVVAKDFNRAGGVVDAVDWVPDWVPVVPKNERRDVTADELVRYTPEKFQELVNRQADPKLRESLAAYTNLHKDVWDAGVILDEAKTEGEFELARMQTYYVIDEASRKARELPRDNWHR